MKIKKVFVTLLLFTIFIVLQGCAGTTYKYHDFSNGDYEIKFNLLNISGKKSYGKAALIAAYIAEEKKCNYYWCGSSEDYNRYVKMMLGVHNTEHTYHCKCYDKKQEDWPSWNTKDKIEKLEHKYGSWRHIKVEGR